MKKLNNKGFTLIEIVIVIVIIAILAAMLVPSLTQWIENANKKTFLEAANTIKTATLSQLTEEYATGGALTTDDFKKTGDIGKAANCDIACTVSTDGLTGTAGTPATGGYALEYTVAGDNTISKFIVSNNKYKVSFDATTNKWGDVGSSKSN